MYSIWQPRSWQLTWWEDCAMLMLGPVLCRVYPDNITLLRLTSLSEWYKHTVADLGMPPDYVDSMLASYVRWHIWVGTQWWWLAFVHVCPLGQLWLWTEIILLPSLSFENNFNTIAQVMDASHHWVVCAARNSCLHALVNTKYQYRQIFVLSILTYNTIIIRLSVSYIVWLFKSVTDLPWHHTNWLFCTMHTHMKNRKQFRVQSNDTSASNFHCTFICAHVLNMIKWRVESMACKPDVCFHTGRDKWAACS